MKLMDSRPLLSKMNLVYREGKWDLTCKSPVLETNNIIYDEKISKNLEFA